VQQHRVVRRKKRGAFGAGFAKMLKKKRDRKKGAARFLSRRKTEKEEESG
jgi:hypothetical protein